MNALSLSLSWLSKEHRAFQAKMKVNRGNGHSPVVRHSWNSAAKRCFSFTAISLYCLERQEVVCPRASRQPNGSVLRARHVEIAQCAREAKCCFIETECPMSRDKKNDGCDRHSDLGVVTPRRSHPDRTPGFSIVHFLKRKLV